VLKMKILFLSIGNLKSIEENGIYTDLLRKFRDHGHELYAVCPREKRMNLPTEYTEEGGVKFLRIRTGNITSTNLVEKGISTIRIETIFLQEIKKYFADVKFDLVMYSTPPITFSNVVRFIKKRDQAKSYLLLKDIFPQNAVDLKMFGKTNPIYWYFRQQEKKLYQNSDYIGCMSKANVDYLLTWNPEIPKEIVEICPNTIEPVNLCLDNNKVEYIKSKYDLPLNKTLFIYGGNLGKPQGIDFLIQCLESNSGNKEVYFVIAGSGTEYEKLKSHIDEGKLTNVKLLSELPKEDYNMLASCCDVGLIFLDVNFTIPNFPSRTLAYMQASMPVLAATDVNTDIGAVIQEGKFGYWCESCNVDEFNQLVQQLCDQDLRNEMGKNARQYLEDHYTARHSYDIIMRHFQ
jgi:glycosyltransferase involved in cell wall biosynthesis